MLDRWSYSEDGGTVYGSNHPSEPRFSIPLEGDWCLRSQESRFQYAERVDPGFLKLENCSVSVRTIRES